NFSPDGKLLYSDAEDETIRGWRLTDGKEVSRFRVYPGADEQEYQPGFEFGPIALSPDGKVLACASYEPNDRCGPHALIRVWESTTRAERLRFLLRDGADRNLINSMGMTFRLGNQTVLPVLTFAPGGKLLALGHGDTIQLWDIARRKHIRQFGGSRV